MPEGRSSSYILVALACLLVFQGCDSFSGRSFLPRIAGYNEKTKHVYVLKKKLLEVSGIWYETPSRMSAINDEQGVLFHLNLSNNDLESFKFKGKGDYEDLVKSGKNYYIMESNGDIHEVAVDSGVVSKQYKFPFEDKVEFESLVLYGKENRLVLISKDQRTKRSGIIAYGFDLASKQFLPEPVFSIPMKDIFQILQDYSGECKPSAAALNPKTNKLMIIASIGKVLLECSRDGRLEKAYKLNPGQFPQPEGISFATNGDMYISNEGLNGKATILHFPYGN
jgi:uncharacterized protein YjiK